MVLVLLVSMPLTIAEVSEEEIAKVEDLSETAIKKQVGEWLESKREVVQVYEEARYHKWEKWPTFHIKNSSKYPDLLAKCKFEDEKNHFYIAIELKSGDEHNKLLEGYDSILKYFIEYSLFGAQYYVDEVGKNDLVPIKIDLFALATNYSPLGFLYKEEGKYDYKIMRGWKAYPSTATYARLLFHQRKNIHDGVLKLAQIPESDRIFSSEVTFKNHLPHLGVLFKHPDSEEGNIRILYSDTSHGYRRLIK